jgi:integrase
MVRMNLESKEARAHLKSRAAPYLAPMQRSLHIGYRKNKTGSVWCVRFRSDGRYIMQTIGGTDDSRPADNDTVLNFAQARRKADDLIDSLKHSASQREDLTRAAGSYTVEDAITDYLDWFRLKRKSYDHTKKLCNRHIVSKLGNIPVNSLTAPKIDRWVRNIAKSPPSTPTRIARLPYAVKLDSGKTNREGNPIYKFNPLPYQDWTDDMRRKRKSSANRILTVLKAALNYAWRNGYASNQGAWARVKPFENADASRIAHISQKQAQDLLKACTDDFRPMARAALMTGCRYGELCNLLADDFKGDHIHIRISKTGKMRDIPLSDAGITFFKSLAKGKGRDELLLTHKDGRKWGHSHQIRPMVKACQKAEIEPAVSFHILRHTYATLLLETKKGKPGMSIRDVAALLGDTVATCEKHYGHVIQDALKKEVARKLPSFGGGL